MLSSLTARYVMDFGHKDSLVDYCMNSIQLQNEMTYNMLSVVTIVLF